MIDWILDYWSRQPVWGRYVLVTMLALMARVLYMTWQTCKTPEIHEEEDYYHD